MMLRTPFLIGLAIAASLGGAQLAAAAPGQPVLLSGDVKVDKLVTEGGTQKHVLLEPKIVVPGDHLVFTTAYHNVGAASVKNFVLTNPLPAGIALSADTAAGYQVSVDGGKDWSALATATVTDGKGGRRAAEAGDVTHIRWTIALIAPGASGTVEYRATVK